LQGYPKDRKTDKTMPTNSAENIQYNKKKRLKTKEEVEQYFPGFIAFVDVTEQLIPRPENRLRRRVYYSGKRKKHIQSRTCTQ
jgi:hypothetical protein